MRHISTIQPIALFFATPATRPHRAGRTEGAGAAVAALKGQHPAEDQSYRRHASKSVDSVMTVSSAAKGFERAATTAASVTIVAGAIAIATNEPLYGLVTALAGAGTAALMEARDRQARKRCERYCRACADHQHAHGIVPADLARQLADSLSVVVEPHPPSPSHTPPRATGERAARLTSLPGRAAQSSGDAQ